MTSRDGCDTFKSVNFCRDWSFFSFGRCLPVRVNVTLACTECKRRNYITTKNKKNDPNRIEMKKYCRWCGSHTMHKETK
ncbi:ribosomal protein L33 [Candidatus Desulforudis audaxviator MP104C]|nr:ribosomal protein L33 [Candidatus Desulforudis audaxviator MP104C]